MVPVPPVHFPFRAFPNLAFDGFLALVIAGIAGVDYSGHANTPFTSFSADGAQGRRHCTAHEPPTRHFRPRCRTPKCCVLFPGGRTGADCVKLTQFLPLPQKQAFVSRLQSRTTSANPTLPVLKSSSAPLRLMKIGALIFSPGFATVERSKERAFEQKEKLWRRRALHHRKNRMDFTAI